MRSTDEEVQVRNLVDLGRELARVAPELPGQTGDRGDDCRREQPSERRTGGPRPGAIRHRSQQPPAKEREHDRLGDSKAGSAHQRGNQLASGASTATSRSPEPGSHRVTASDERDQQP